MHTAGALHGLVTPFTVTLRPEDSRHTPSVYCTLRPLAEDPQPERRYTMLPPPMPASMSDLGSSIFHTRPTPTGVIQAIILSYQIDKGMDQPYKPEKDTTFREALSHLKREGYILIQGGRISPTLRELYHLLMWESGLTYLITWDEVVELLECNYPVNQAPPTQQEDVGDSASHPNGETLPCSAPKPIPVPGVGLYCCEGYGVDLDDIHPDQWQPITFPAGVSHQTLYCGDVMIDDQLADVWWSLALSCFLAQFLSQEELLRRFPHLNTSETSST